MKYNIAIIWKDLQSQKSHEQSNSSFHKRSERLNIILSSFHVFWCNVIDHIFFYSEHSEPRGRMEINAKQCCLTKLSTVYDVRHLLLLIRFTGLNPQLTVKNIQFFPLVLMSFYDNCFSILESKELLVKTISWNDLLTTHIPMYLTMHSIYRGTISILMHLEVGSIIL